MIDGIKAHIKTVDVGEFLNNPRLSFTGKYNASTGEVMKGTLTAQYNGLTIRLTPSTVANETHCMIDGSLHRFYNSGGSNNTDFHFWQLSETLSNVESLFKEQLNKITLQNIEFGINLNTDLAAAKIIRSIVSNGGRRFAELCAKDIPIGKVCTKQGADYELKIYDKGKQAETTEKRMLRIEIKVKKMRFLEPYNIATLADLLHPEKIGILGQILADMWDGLVFYDGSIDETKLSIDDRLKLKDYQNPLYWEDLNFKTRYKARVHFAELMAKYSPRTLQNDIREMIFSKWEKLVNTGQKSAVQNHKKEAEKKGCFHQLLNESEAEEKGMFSPFKYRVKTSPQNPSKNKSDKKVFCSICGREITHQKPGSKFCSEKYFGKSARKCRNKAGNQYRTERNRTNRQQARQMLDELKPNIDKSLRLKVQVKTDTGFMVQKTTRTTIKSINYGQLRKIVGAAGSCGGVPFSFSTSIAKEFIKVIINQKFTNNETKKRGCKQPTQGIFKDVQFW